MLVDFQSACEARGSVQTLVLIILNYLSFSKKVCVHLDDLVLVLLWITDDMTA